MPKMRGFHWWGWAAGATYISSFICSMASIQFDSANNDSQTDWVILAVILCVAAAGFHVVWGLEVSHDRGRRRP